MGPYRPRKGALPPPDQRTLANLSRIPWCAALINDKSLTAYISPSRRVKPDGADRLFNSTLNTATTIPEYVALYRDPEEDHDDGPITELMGILSLGPDVNGFPGVCHGGIVSTLLDEVMGELINVNLKYRTIRRTSYMTGYLNTAYKGKVATPGTYLVVARMAKIDGRKLFISATVEDGEGAVLATGEALFIGLREPIGRL